ncbi:MAG: hypothetical protein ABJC98_15860 [Bacteroidota bacterium]
MPVFSDELNTLNGKLVSISGFYIPMELNSRKCAVSKNPNITYFFCGGGSIQTIMIVNFAATMRNFNDDDLITIKGKLVLSNSFKEFIFNLEEAHYVKSE